MMPEQPAGGVDRPAVPSLRIRPATFQDPRQAGPAGSGTVPVPPAGPVAASELSRVAQPGMPSHAGAPPSWPPVPSADGGPGRPSISGSGVLRMARLAAVFVGIVALGDGVVGGLFIVGSVSGAGRRDGIGSGPLIIIGSLILLIALLMGRSAYRLSKGDARGIRRGRTRMAMHMTIPIGVVVVAFRDGGVSVSQLVFAVVFFAVLVTGATLVTVAMDGLPEPAPRRDPPREH